MIIIELEDIPRQPAAGEMYLSITGVISASTKEHKPLVTTRITAGVFNAWIVTKYEQREEENKNNDT